MPAPRDPRAPIRWPWPLPALRAFRPAPMAADWLERLRAARCRPACRAAGPGWWRRLGASAVLVFGVPASPLAQPWVVVAGNTLSALVGVACVRVASVQRHLAELIPLFGSSGHHHIPIVDGGDKLVGIVTQSDVVAALARPGVPNQ